jgi:hypothetical protein
MSPQASSTTRVARRSMATRPRASAPSAKLSRNDLFYSRPLSYTNFERVNGQAQPRKSTGQTNGESVLPPDPRVKFVRRKPWSVRVPLQRVMLFTRTFDAIFELAPIMRELFGHFVDPAWHIATDYRREGHPFTDMEFTGASCTPVGRLNRT